MATYKRALLESVVIVTFLVCSYVELTYSKGARYTLHDGWIDQEYVMSFRSQHTLHKRQAVNNTSPVTSIQEVSQNHRYYTTKLVSGRGEFNKYWDELHDAKLSEPLSGSYRKAFSVPITFGFKFYGHDVSKVTISTGGFLYMSPFLHAYLTSTQYIAPLMANFDTSIGNIRYKDYGDKFVVEWRDIFLQDQSHTNPFSFQTTLLSNGTIYFAYKEVPVEVLDIETNNHPVKVGVADAYYIDTIKEGRQRRTIYEYHKVEVNFTWVRPNNVIILEPLPTCNLAQDCNTCLTQDTSFDCKWCPEVSRCSDGTDWLRQEWQEKGCENSASNQLSSCRLSSPTSTRAEKKTA